MAAIKKRLNPVFYTEKKDDVLRDMPDWFNWLDESGECRLVFSELPGIEKISIGQTITLVRGGERVQAQRIEMNPDWTDDYEVELRYLGEDLMY